MAGIPPGAGPSRVVRRGGRVRAPESSEARGPRQRGDDVSPARCRLGSRRMSPPPGHGRWVRLCGGGRSALADALRKLSASVELRETAGLAARHAIAPHTIETWADAVFSALRIETTSGGVPRACPRVRRCGVQFGRPIEETGHTPRYRRRVACGHGHQAVRLQPRCRRRGGGPARRCEPLRRRLEASSVRRTRLLSAACFGGVTTCSPSAGSRDGARAVGRPGLRDSCAGPVSCGCAGGRGHLGGRIAVLATSFIAARALSPAGFGELLASLATALIAAILWDVGVSVLVEREVAARHVDGRGAIRRARGLRLMALPAWVAAFGLGSFYVDRIRGNPWSSALFASTSLATGVRLLPAAVLRANSPVSADGATLATGRWVTTGLALPALAASGDVGGFGHWLPPPWRASWSLSGAAFQLRRLPGRDVRSADRHDLTRSVVHFRSLPMTAWLSSTTVWTSFGSLRRPPPRKSPNTRRHHVCRTLCICFPRTGGCGTDGVRSRVVARIGRGVVRRSLADSWQSAW